jgi:hypothetical protein
MKYSPAIPRDLLLAWRQRRQYLARLLAQVALDRGCIINMSGFQSRGQRLRLFLLGLGLDFALGALGWDFLEDLDIHVLEALERCPQIGRRGHGARLVKADG